ncbi:MAG TPA: hypothetical protein RMH99_06080, partial [Sandaracinaceae bacterium LLY-WYZ-13_1]|nr:hypothetical protein [Sandaracinaceae bacterium LLY-WYZ-13_1]
MRAGGLGAVVAALALIGCADDGAPQTRRCGERLLPDPVAPVTAVAAAPSFALGPCGELAVAGREGLRLAGPELASLEAVATDVTEVRMAPLGGQLWGRGRDRMLWLDLETRRTTSVEQARATGFAGDVAWACRSDGLHAVDAEGTERRAEAVAGCERIWSAPRAPVVVYVTGEETLAWVDLEGGNGGTLEDVDYQTLRGDQLRLSPDGRVLQHRVRAGGSWLALFDLEAAAGERLLAAFESSGGPAVHEAPGAGHVLAVELAAEDATVILTEDLWLNRYEGARFHAFAPGGDRALLRFGRETGGAGWTFDVAHLDGTRLEPTGVEVGSGVSVVRSAEGGAAASRYLNAYHWQPLHVWRWSDGDHAIARDDVARIDWVSEEGVVLARLDDGPAVLIDAGGTELARWEAARSVTAWRVNGGDATLVRVVPAMGAAHRLVRVGADGEARTIAEGTSIADVSVDGDGERVAFVRTDGGVSELWAGSL